AQNPPIGSVARAKISPNRAQHLQIVVNRQKGRLSHASTPFRRSPALAGFGTGEYRDSNQRQSPGVLLSAEQYSPGRGQCFFLLLDGPHRFSQPQREML